MNPLFLWNNKLKLSASVGLAIVVGCSGNKGSGDNAAPYPENISFTVTNTANLSREDAALTIAVDNIRQANSQFNPDNFMALSGDQELPSQAVDIDDNGDIDQIVIMANWAPLEEKPLTLRFHPQGHRTRTYPQRAQAEISVKTGGEFVERKYIGGTFENITHLDVPAEHTDHSDYIRYEGPGWESDKVAYRYYLDWRNATDITGKKVPEMVLQDMGQDGSDSYHEMDDWGMDILQVSESLGIGSIGMWIDDKAERVAKTAQVTASVSANGPLLAGVKTHYPDWQVGGGTYQLSSSLSISAGSRLTRHDLTISPMPDNLCTGLVKHADANIFSAADSDGDWTYLASYGRQTVVPDNLGMAILYRRNQLLELSADEYSHVVVLKPEAGELTYYFLAAWEQEPGGIKDEFAFRLYLDGVLRQLNSPLKVSL